MIANELIEALALYPFTAAQMALILAIIRRSYGYHLKTAQLSTAEFEALTGLGRRTVQRSLGTLLAGRVVHSMPGAGTRSSTWVLNKDFDQWNLRGKGRLI